MTALPLTSLVTLFVLILLSLTAFNVGRARGRYGVKAPAVSGHEMFERAFRVQMNTLEGVVLMLPALWLRYGWISLSLMSCHMMRVISSPSISTTVPATLIFCMWFNLG